MGQEKQAESFINRARIKLKEAEDQLSNAHYDISVSASQESLEFSVKALFLSLGIPFKPKHEIKEMDFGKAIEKLSPDEAKFHNFPRVLLMSKFWSYFYIVSKYGFEKLEVGADKLFKREEAELSVKHARDCFNACYYIFNHRKFGSR